MVRALTTPLASASTLLLLMLVVVSPARSVTATKNLPECIDPPGNGPIADIIVAALENMKPLFVSGIPALGIPPLDPLGPLPSIKFGVHNDALQLDGSVNDTTVRNLAQFITCQVNVSVGVNQKFDIVLKLDNFHVDGVYDVNGLAVSLFPIFGHGNYTLDTYDSGFRGAATVVYNILQDRISIKDLLLDIYFEDLQLVMECLLGCGQMADFMNKYLSEIGEAIFFAVWESVGPILSQSIEDFINDALYNISASSLLPQSVEGQLGNANTYLDLVLANTAQLLLDTGLDPAALPDTSLSIAAQAELVNGSLTGLSTVRRSGTATVDTVTDWIFLYANIALGPVEARYPGVVTEDGITDTFEVLVSLQVVDVYLTARGDVFSLVLDLDQFVVSELGPVNVELKGLGVLGWLAGPITEAVVNLFLDDVQTMLSNQLKDAIQGVLNENPWPGS